MAIPDLDRDSGKTANLQELGLETTKMCEQIMIYAFVPVIEFSSQCYTSQRVFKESNKTLNPVGENIDSDEYVTIAFPEIQIALSISIIQSCPGRVTRIGINRPFRNGCADLIACQGQVAVIFTIFIYSLKNWLIILISSQHL